MASQYSYSYRGDRPHPSSGGGGAGVLALVGIVGLGVWGYKKFGKPILKAKEVQREVQRMIISGAKAGLDIKHKKVWLSFTINNPNSKPLKILAITGVISIHPNDPKQMGFNVGDIDRFVPIDIKPVSATQVQLTVTLKAVNTIAYLAEVLTGKWVGQNLVFKGTVNANGTPYPVVEMLKLG